MRSGRALVPVRSDGRSGTLGRPHWQARSQEVWRRRLTCRILGRATQLIRASAICALAIDDFGAPIRQISAMLPRHEPDLVDLDGASNPTGDLWQSTRRSPYAWR